MVLGSLFLVDLFIFMFRGVFLFCFYWLCCFGFFFGYFLFLVGFMVVGWCCLVFFFVFFVVGVCVFGGVWW